MIDIVLILIANCGITNHCSLLRKFKLIQTLGICEYPLVRILKIHGRSLPALANSMDIQNELYNKDYQSGTMFRQD